MDTSDEEKSLLDNNTDDPEQRTKKKNCQFSSALQLRYFDEFLSELSYQRFKRFMAVVLFVIFVVLFVIFVVLFVIFVVLLTQLQSLRSDNIYLKNEVEMLKAESNKATSSNMSLALHHNQFELKTLSKNLGIEHINRMLNALDVQISNLSKIVLKSGKISTPSLNKEKSNKTKMNSIHSQDSMIRKWNTTRPNRLWRLWNSKEAKYEDMKKLIGKLKETLNFKIAYGLNILNTRVKNIEERCKSENTTRQNQLPSRRTETVSKTGRGKQQTTRNKENSKAKSIGTLTHQYNESLRLYSKCYAKMNEIEKKQSQFEKHSKNKLLDVGRLMVSNKTLYRSTEKIQQTQESLQTDLKKIKETQQMLKTKMVEKTQVNEMKGKIQQKQESLQTDLKKIKETQQMLKTKMVEKTQVNEMKGKIQQTQGRLQKVVETLKLHNTKLKSLEDSSKLRLTVHGIICGVLFFIIIVVLIYLCCEK